MRTGRTGTRSSKISRRPASAAKRQADPARRSGWSIATRRWLQGGTAYSYSRFCWAAEGTSRQPGPRGADVLRLCAGALGPGAGFSGKTLPLRTGRGRTRRGNLRRGAGPLLPDLCRARSTTRACVTGRWCTCRAFEYFGGVPGRLIIDKPQVGGGQAGPRAAPCSIRASVSSPSTTTSPCCLRVRSGPRTRDSWRAASAPSRAASCWRCARVASSRWTQ